MPTPLHTTSKSRREFLSTATGTAATLAAASLGACRKVPGVRFPQPRAENVAPFQPPGSEIVDLVTHVLNRTTWGIAPGERERVLRMGSTQEAAVEAYLQEQLSANPNDIADHPVERQVRQLEPLHASVAELYDTSPRELNFQLTKATILRFHRSPHQLREIMVSFWTDHFNIDCSKTECRWLKALDDREVIRKHALGNFRDLLQASVLSPAMLFYLDGRSNRKVKPEDRPNENHARELLELHTMGVDGGYRQEDVMEVARILSGWTVNGKQRLPGDYKSLKATSLGGRMRNTGLAILGLESKIDPFWGLGRVHFVANFHDHGPKKLLNTELEVTNAQDELSCLIEVLAAHPATARFLAKKLCRRFINDEPRQESIDAVAAAYIHAKGGIPETLRAIFRTEEFLTARNTRLKRPLHWLISALRATGANTQAASPVQQYLRRAGQLPFEYPTPDGYSDNSQDWTSTLLARWDMALRLAKGSLADCQVPLKSLLAATQGRPGLARHLLGREPFAHEMEAFATVPDNPTEDAEFLALALSSPGFQSY